jgi:D-alanine transaminase
VYLNGEWLPQDQATIRIEDRGFMFADGVYEVVRFYNHHPIAMDDHMHRMKTSLDRVRIQYPDDLPPLDVVSRKLLEHNDLPDASVYWQVTRGVAPRKHKFPPPGTRPTVLAVAYPQHAFDAAAPVTALKAITRPEIRWAYCSIKSISLLPNVLDAQAAVDAGADEAILVREDGIVTEATARSVIITEGKTLLTHPLDGRILDSPAQRRGDSRRRHHDRNRLRRRS